MSISLLHEMILPLKCLDGGLLKSSALYNEDHANILKSETNKNNLFGKGCIPTSYYVTATLNTKTVYYNAG
jgi:hypothetical protein